MTRAAHKPVLLPSKTTSMGGATLAAGAWLRAVKHLRLQHPVVVKWSNGLRTIGRYRWIDGQHVITLSTYDDAATVSNTAWHELTHAWQYEQAFAQGMTYAQASRSFRAGEYGPSDYRYRTRPIEVQARKWAAHYHAQLPLAT